MADKALSDLDDSQKTSQLEVYNLILLLFIAENLVNILIVGAWSHLQNFRHKAMYVQLEMKKIVSFLQSKESFFFNTISAMVSMYIWG